MRKMKVMVMVFLGCLLRWGGSHVHADVVSQSFRDLKHHWKLFILGEQWICRVLNVQTSSAPSTCSNVCGTSMHFTRCRMPPYQPHLGLWPCWMHLHLFANFIVTSQDWESQ